MYRRGYKSKVLTVLVLVLVLGLSIGFAAFSNTLTIDSQATITPDQATFDIDFSSSSTGVQTNDITPTLYGTGLTAEKAVIDNSASPTITNLSVKFTRPGQKAVYSFYAYNNGEYLAYLNSINFLNAEGKDTFKTCVAQEAGTQYVNEACQGIKVSVKVGSYETDETDYYIAGHSLEVKKAAEVIVTIEYEEGSAVADGPFTVIFGDITLVYTTLDGILSPENPNLEQSLLTQLRYKILDDNTAYADNVRSPYVNSDKGIDFSKISSDTNGKGLYYTSNNTMDNKTSYYFRGDVDNNYVQMKVPSTCVYNGQPVAHASISSVLNLNNAVIKYL